MDPAAFSAIYRGKEVALYKISNEYLTCYITNYGARVVSLITKDKSGQSYDVVLGFDSIDGYFDADEKYHGATVGRFANRISGGEFYIGEQKYVLDKNNGPNSLHGGPGAFHNQVWDVIEITEKEVLLKYISPHMEEGFPGELFTTVSYKLVGSDLRISYEAIASEDTIINLTHHSYFNLNGEGTGHVLDHLLEINSEYYTPVNANTIPTGKLDLVSGTPFDFQKEKSIGRDIHLADDQLALGFGYDHNFVVRLSEKNELSYVAKAKGDKSGISMEVWSTEPGVQFYSANHLSGKDIGKSGKRYCKHGAFCLETQHFPDSPNQDHFPSTLLKLNNKFTSCTEYRFAS